MSDTMFTMAGFLNSADDALQNDERHVAPQTVAKSPSVGLNIANATKTGYLFCKEKGIFDPETAKAFRTLLEKGGTEDPMDLYRTFRGAEPNNNAMLVGRGLK